MNTVLAVCLVACVALAAARPEEKYTDKYDNINVHEIIENIRLLKPYVECALDKAPCTAEGKELKSHLKDALENNCGKCTEVQKENTKIVIGHLINERPEYWNELKEKYDPQGLYSAQHEEELKKLKH